MPVVRRSLIGLALAFATAQAEAAPLPQGVPPPEPDEPEPAQPTDPVLPEPTPEPVPEPEPAPVEPRPTPARDPAPVVASPTVPPPRAFARPTLTLGEWRVVLSGFVQVDSVPWSQASLDELDPSTREPLNETGLSIPRARLRADAQLAGITAAVELDGNTTDGVVSRLLGAYVQWAYPARTDVPWIALAAGLIKIPFGAEVPASERDKPFLEPPALSRALFPGNYDVGAMAHGGLGLLRWSVAVMNGAPVADAQWTGKDPSSSYDLVGRVGVDVAGPLQTRFIAGMSGLRGTGLHPGVPPTKNDFQWIDEDQDGLVENSELVVLPGSPGEPSSTFDRNALGLDLDIGWVAGPAGPGHVLGEAAYATNLDRGLFYADPLSTSRDLRELGFAVGVIQSVTRHALVGARYDRYDADRDAAERAGVDLVRAEKIFSTLSFMASGRYHSARLLVQYDHVRNPFGRDDSGLAATREEDRLTIRAQAEF